MNKWERFKNEFNTKINQPYTSKEFVSYLRIAYNAKFCDIRNSKYRPLERIPQSFTIKIMKDLGKYYKERGE